jgi:hypothetical protein
MVRGAAPPSWYDASLVDESRAQFLLLARGCKLGQCGHMQRLAAVKESSRGLQVKWSTDLKNKVEVGDNSAGRRYPLHQRHIGRSTVGRVPAGSTQINSGPNCLVWWYTVFSC